jgi:ABC-2 type transport system permease protein
VIPVLLNELFLVARDRRALAWLLLGPILIITVISAARYQGGAQTRILLPVVDEDQGPVARSFIKLLGNNAFPLEVDRAEAEAMVRDRGRPAAIVFPAGLSKRYLQGRPSEILLLTDPAEAAGLRRVKALLLLMDREAAELADPVGGELVTFTERNLTGDRIARKSHEQSVPGFTIMFTLLSAAYGTSTSLHLEARSGTLARLLIAPVGFGRILLAKLLARSLIGGAQMLILLEWGRLIFGISLGSSVWALLAVAFATAFAAVALGSLTAGIARTSEQALSLSLTIVLPLCAISGLWWPFYVEPAWMQSVGSAVFPTWSMQSLTDLVLRDRGLSAVWPSVCLILAEGAFLLTAGIRLFRAQLASR